MNTKEKYKFKRFITNLDSIRGRHTELVSVYIPAGYDLNKIINHLAQEQGTASNIKDKATRDNVINSLEKMIRHLRLFNKTPEKGLAVFAGNTLSKEGKKDIQVFSIEPPEPVNTRLYRCDQTFVTDILKSMLETRDIYGLIVMDNREANVGLLKGTRIDNLAHMTSGVPGKIKAGGQSAVRFESLRENAVKEFSKRIAETAQLEFLPIKKELKGILIGGPGHSKNEFLDKDYLNNELKQKVIAIEDLGYTGEFGLQELVDKAKIALAKSEILREEQIMNKFFELLARDTDKVTYGENEVRKAIDYGAVDTLLISESVNDKIAEELETKAEEKGAKVEIISVESRSGVQLKDLGGIAAILRYALQ
ncbi:MAG: peptide chain release factor aRF-1 [Candidatus Woesearchaeota archaeon]|nr:MAG: peptide chain release factor aRF-1 [Candidatus Woesearchaeota archaeon]